MSTGVEQRKTRWLDRANVRRAFQAFAVFAVVNFIAYVVVSQLIGGEAWSGKEVDGRYFLSSHGQLTEVSQALYIYSLWHTISVFVTWPPLLVISLLMPGDKK
jgi:hypothetical protein